MNYDLKCAPGKVKFSCALFSGELSRSYDSFFFNWLYTDCTSGPLSKNVERFKIKVLCICTIRSQQRLELLRARRMR